ncbi:MAG: hypothetical protein R6V54_04760 [Desulfobacteraceae bacterium]
MKKKIDKKAIEEKLAQLDDRIEILQEPVHRVFEKIEVLIDQSKATNNIELMEFKLELSTLLERFYNEMVDVHDLIIEDFEEIENDLKRT